MGRVERGMRSSEYYWSSAAVKIQQGATKGGRNCLLFGRRISGSKVDQVEVGETIWSDTSEARIRSLL